MVDGPEAVCDCNRRSWARFKATGGSAGWLHVSPGPSTTHFRTASPCGWTRVCPSRALTGRSRRFRSRAAGLRLRGAGGAPSGHTPHGARFGSAYCYRQQLDYWTAGIRPTPRVAISPCPLRATSQRPRSCRAFGCLARVRVAALSRRSHPDGRTRPDPALPPRVNPRLARTDRVAGWPCLGGGGPGE